MPIHMPMPMPISMPIPMPLPPNTTAPTTSLLQKRRAPPQSDSESDSEAEDEAVSAHHEGSRTMRGGLPNRVHLAGFSETNHQVWSTGPWQSVGAELTTPIDFFEL
eukprot:TRINITY_DN12339_c0_g1_i1.p2 TRINITY_DN12339_c0_g1~~TRINITY_DN12339_c0_g1_i1.p2  ORF type:complete len:106 (+),score=28.29 TRINITY_DN12339_c0_g1_i1:714-1031(+)